MKEALEIYWPALIVTIAFSCLISYLGIHLTARKQSVALIPQSQMTVIAILLGILFFHEQENLPILIFAFIITFFSGMGLQFLPDKLKQAQTEWLLGIYFILLALGHSLIRLSPHLESHFHHSFQGDIATASNSSLLGSFILITVLGFILFVTKKRDREKTFDIAIGKKISTVFFHALTSLALTTGVFLLGSAFTIAFLILPSLLMSQFSSSYKKHLFYVALLSFLSSSLGFLLSLKFSTLSTTPTMTLSLVGVFLVLRLLKLLFTSSSST